MQIYKWQYKNLKFNTLDFLRRYNSLRDQIQLMPKVIGVVQEKKEVANGELFQIKVLYQHHQSLESVMRMHTTTKYTIFEIINYGK